MGWQVGVDTGGTHTDIVFRNRETGRLATWKVPTTPADLTRGILRGVREVMEREGIVAAEVETFAYGTTMVTNLIVEERQVPVGLLTTAGFRDVLEIGRASRKPNVYDIHWRPQPPLVPRYLRHEVAERLLHDGSVHAPLDPATVVAAVEALVAEGVRSVAVCYMHAYANPVHERRTRDIIAAGWPDLLVSLSSDIVREFREFERTSTTALNAYVKGPMADHLDRLKTALTGLGLDARCFIMRGNGGVMGFENGKAIPVAITHSGPVAGIIGGREIGRAAGLEDIITFDMGGTSSDIAVVTGGRPEFTSRGRLANHPVLLPMLDLVTIGAGGGSIAHLDRGGALKVGPRSAGSVPGPMCYAQGGEDPTITDANIVCGRLNPDYFLAGTRVIDPELSRRGIADRIAGPLGMTVEDAALGILAIAESHMVNAIKLATVQRGLDPRDYALAAFGGAGPLHAVALADALGISRVVVPPAPGNVSASGLLSAAIIHDAVMTAIQPVDALDRAELGRRFRTIEADVAAGFTADGVAAADVALRRSLDLRYLGQSFEMSVDVTDLAEEAGFADRLRQRFHDLHRQQYGYAMPSKGIEMVNLRIQGASAVAEGFWPRKTGERGAGPEGLRRVLYAGAEPADWPVWRHAELPPGSTLTGPAIVEYPGSTFVLPHGWSGTVDAVGTILAVKSQPQPKDAPS